MMARPLTLIEVSQRMNAGTDEECFALSEFLDSFYGFLRGGYVAAAQASIDAEPEPLADFVAHAHLGAVGEHLALRWGLVVPPWTNHPSRFLKSPHFTSPLEGLKALCIAESPSAFRRRMIFTEAEPLRRARFPRAPGGRALEANEIVSGQAVPNVRARATPPPCQAATMPALALAATLRTTPERG